jgi:hypothetical protein
MAAKKPLMIASGVVQEMSSDTVSRTVLPPRSATVVIPSPTSSEDITAFYTDEAITISKIVCVLVGSASPSVTFDVRHGTDRSAAGTALITSPSATTNTTSGTATTSFNNASVSAGAFVRVKTTAMSGTVTYAEITIIY